MAVLNLLQSINNALHLIMEKDNNVVVLGEDVGKAGGVFRVTEGLWQKFGDERVIDTPLAEGGIIGTAIGMALNGLRPIAEIQFMDFIYPAFDQIVNELAKFRYRSGGQYSAPVIIRTPYGGGIKGGHYHSQSTESFFIHTAGLKVVSPSNPYDAKGLLIAAYEQNDPVLFLEPKRLYRAAKCEVPEQWYTVPIGPVNIIKEGKDITLISWGATIEDCKQAIKVIEEEENITVELIDVRTLSPFDENTICESVKKTGRVVIVHEAAKTCGFGAEISATIAENVIEYLLAPIKRVCGLDTPFPYTLEHYYLPNPSRIKRAIKEVLLFS
ncbi:MAG: alpha-ketoacid dehydrogenase subunit beta [Planctomycetota bacterium]